MGTRGCHDPFGSPAILTEKVIGAEYDTIQYVARYVETIRYVAEHMASVYAVAAQLRTQMVVNGTTSDVGNTVTLSLPVGVALDNIVSSTVLVTGSNDELAPDSSGYFSSILNSDGLNLTLKNDAPAAFENAAFKWFIIYTVTP